MRIFLEEPEMMTIRDALNSYRKSLELSFESRPENKNSQLVVDVVESAYSRIDKLILFFDQKLFRDEE